ncbi:hypothetical protein [Paenibacillus mucilaginosus]|uniref:Uncharacterized protein n=1 Tax=Paenibacillus mucilaginosus (strain KNP414) TaxID=1036673 RepID=F8FNB1_PAEMK|nr:hypothetical protein [Paenibacillus mucilaginosus]AEI38948.1 hypothetical protein KNP414_00323 [Paenibacillus mucilaginosus KNP414]MCG7216570.1 hypothetical protein [Paenibacillus mucilaginosus]WDM27995.1 hypothetical protein KCX80_01565 [Paenibacillus mucilaginosus]
MTKRGAGVAFCALSAFLTGVYELSAAIYPGGTPSGTLTFWSRTALIVGIIYLILGEIREWDKD